MPPELPPPELPPPDSRLRARLLGCGPSGGVPLVGPRWGRCDPGEPRNRRQRCSMLVESGATRVLIDTAPDLRAQLLAADINRLDAVVWTHAHADHLNGIDELRAINQLIDAPLPGYADAATLDQIRHSFGYVLEPLRQGVSYHYKPTVIPHVIDGPFRIGDLAFLPTRQDHGYSTSLGFRIGRLAYSVDVVRLSDADLAALDGIAVWIVDCYRETPHSTHSHLAQTLDWIARVRPARAILTHMGEDLDYQTLCRQLPAGIEPGYDGMVIEID